VVGNWHAFDIAWQGDDKKASMCVQTHTLESETVPTMGSDPVYDCDNGR